MKELLSFLIIAILSIQQLIAQTKTAMPPKPDIQRLMKMSPTQREKYADSLRKASGEYAEEEAAKAGVVLNETTLPNFEIKPPVKDFARLALIPSQPRARSELVVQIQKSKEQLQSAMPTSKVAEIEQFAKQNKPSTIHQAAIASFYNNEPEKALLLMTKVATAQPDSVIVWNNLAAMYNHTGLQHRAAPLLFYCLQQAPESSLVLNNLGQCYMGLGDLEKAQQYFIECLDIDSLNPDANHSMGMLHMFVNNYDEAMKCFNRELTVAIRSSTLAYAAKMGKKINLRALVERKNSLSGRPNKDYFEEISLGKFIIPTYPKTVPEAYEQVEEYTTFAASVQQEMQFWNSIRQISAQKAAIEGEKNPGLYTSLVNVMLDELHEEFTPAYLSYIDENDAGTAMEIITKYENMLAKVKCPKPPAGSSIDAEIAYEIKCCTTKQQPIRNLRLAEYGSFWRPKINVAQQRWKSYINQLIAIVQLDPSPGNQLLVYRQVASYFSFLGNSLLYSGTAEAVNKSLPFCNAKYNIQEADSVITADHNWRVQCPAWLNIEVDVEVAKIKADCSKYSIEAGSSIVGQYEYDFKTGSSTLAAGYGIKAKFAGGIVKAGMKKLAYVTFDNNNQLADYGVRGKAEVGIADNPINIGPLKVGGTVLGVEGNYQFGINSGFTSSVKGKGILADFIKIDRSL